MPVDNQPEKPQGVEYELQVDAVSGVRADFELQAGQKVRFQLADPADTWTIKGLVCGAGGNGRPIGDGIEGSLGVGRRSSWSEIKTNLSKFFSSGDDIVEMSGPGVFRLSARYLQQGHADGTSHGSILVKAFVS